MGWVRGDLPPCCKEHNDLARAGDGSPAHCAGKLGSFNPGSRVWGEVIEVDDERQVAQLGDGSP